MEDESSMRAFNLDDIDEVIAEMEEEERGLPPGKCKFVGRCDFYAEKSPTCNKTAGMYYGVNRPGGCYRDNEKRELSLAETQALNFQTSYVGGDFF
tara:strand:+ start:560 stop:847 length:288 start_codon:yes stop_codon:yes gene_type:complete